MKLLTKALIALTLTQTDGFSASRLTMLEPVLMSGIRRATSLVSPSVTRYSTSISQPDISGRFSPSFRRLHPTSSLATPSLFRVSRRLFSSQAPEHHSRRIYHPRSSWWRVS